jgi:hypothetical protein
VVAAGTATTTSLRFTYNNQDRRFWNQDRRFWKEICDDWHAHERMLGEGPRSR